MDTMVNMSVVNDLTYAVLEIADEAMDNTGHWSEVFGEDIQTFSDAFDYIQSGFIEGQGGIDTVIEWLEDYDEKDWFGYKCAALVQYIKDVM